MYVHLYLSTLPLKDSLIKPDSARKQIVVKKSSLRRTRTKNRLFGLNDTDTDIDAATAIAASLHVPYKHLNSSSLSLSLFLSLSLTVQHGRSPGPP